jgi:hypothetical protein
MPSRAIHGHCSYPNKGDELDLRILQAGRVEGGPTRHRAPLNTTEQRQNGFQVGERVYLR